MTSQEARRASLTRHFGQGDIIFREGEDGREMLVVRKGRVRIFRKTGDSELTLAELGPGESFGEMSILDQTTRSATAMALEETDLVVVEEHAFENMLKERPDIAVRLLKKLSARLREANRQIQLLTVHGSAARVVETLRLWSQGRGEGEVLLTGVTPDELWRAAGTRREVFGEILHKLGEVGIARFSGDGLHIQWPQGLDDYLEYLDLKRSFDPATSQELAALRQLGTPVQASQADAEKPVHDEKREDPYARFLQLKERFE
ncbi:MAG: Crp/Fnr family transcriptional regulator [Pseudomonadota bacterium]